VNDTVSIAVGLLTLVVTVRVVAVATPCCAGWTGPSAGGSCRASSCPAPPLMPWDGGSLRRCAADHGGERIL